MSNAIDSFVRSAVYLAFSPLADLTHREKAVYDVESAMHCRRTLNFLLNRNGVTHLKF